MDGQILLISFEYLPWSYFIEARKSELVDHETSMTLHWGRGRRRRRRRRGGEEEKEEEEEK